MDRAYASQRACQMRDSYGAALPLVEYWLRATVALGESDVRPTDRC